MTPPTLTRQGRNVAAHSASEDHVSWRRHLPSAIFKFVFHSFINFVLYEELFT